MIPEKRLEFTQAVTSLIASIIREKGCCRHDLCQSVGDENELFLFGDWETAEDLSSHLRSELFKVLLGAMTLLLEPHVIKFLADLTKTESTSLARQLNLPQTSAQKVKNLTKIKRLSKKDLDFGGGQGQKWPCVTTFFSVTAVLKKCLGVKNRSGYT